MLGLGGNLTLSPSGERSINIKLPGRPRARIRFVVICWEFANNVCIWRVIVLCVEVLLGHWSVSRGRFFDLILSFISVTVRVVT